MDQGARGARGQQPSRAAGDLARPGGVRVRLRLRLRLRLRVRVGVRVG